MVATNETMPWLRMVPLYEGVPKARVKCGTRKQRVMFGCILSAYPVVNGLSA